MTPPVDTWFLKRRLGLFLHFGLYAIDGWHEQDQMRRRIPRMGYGELLRRFNPERFDAGRILDLAEATGMEYVCLTTKHHDGFCLWDTRETDFNVMRSPCGRDLLGELAEACHRRGVPLGLYYSVVDWHHPAYPNQGRHHELAGPEPGDTPDWETYKAFLVRQVRELCTRYGDIRHFFWDMNVPACHAPEINAMIRRLQPGIVINDRGFDEGDFGTPERDYHDAETAGRGRFRRPTEACNSVGSQSWGYRRDEDYHTVPYLIQNIDGIMAKGGHYLLNVGPDADGRVPDKAVRVLSGIGCWYHRTREAFGDTVPCSELTSARDILLTRRGDRTLYVHVTAPLKTDAVLLPPLADTPAHAILLNTGEALPVSAEVLPAFWQDRRRVLAIRNLPVERLTAETPVIRLEFRHPPEAVADTVTAFEG